MGIQWMVRWWVLVQGGVFVLEVSSVSSVVIALDGGP
jgi:hypothetical protein